MNLKIKRIILTETDKKVIVKNLNICTDSHSLSCSLNALKIHDVNLN